MLFRSQAAKIGIVWHTSYTGKSIDTLSTHFDVNISSLKKSRNVWFRTNRFTDVTGKATLTKSEKDRLDKILKEIGSLFRTIPAGVLNQIASSESYREPIMTYYNQKVRAGEHMGAGHVNEIIKFITDRYAKKIADAKMPATKDKKTKERNLLIAW